MDLGFTLDATLQQYERITEPAIVLQSVIECLNLKHHVQKCFEIANRAIPQIVDPLLISKFDPSLCDHIIQVIIDKFRDWDQLNLTKERLLLIWLLQC
jgi:hypothetical protein